MLRVFGSYTAEAIERAMVVRRTVRGTGMTGVIRVIGVMMRGERGEESPMFLMVGSGRGGEGWGGRECEVLYRENMKWDDVEERFEVSLEKKWMKVGDVVRDEGGEGNEVVERKCMFSMTWTRMTDTGGGNVLTSVPEPCEVLGSLETSVPCVVVRGGKNCEEVLGVRREG